MPDNNATETANKIGDHGDRERFIRDLYALAAFFTSRTDIPVPGGLTVHVRADTKEVNRIAESMGVPEYGSKYPDGVAQADFQLPNTVTDVQVFVSARGIGR